MSREWSDISDEALGRRLAAELPRYGAPAGLRATVVAARIPARARPGWFGPAVSALATAMVFVLLLMPALPLTAPGDAVDRLVGAVVAEHTRALLWGARHPDVIPTALPWLTQESGIALARTFLGDDTLTFDGAEPVYLDWRRGVALHYRDQDGHRLTYIALPAPRMPLPDRRVEVNGFRPALKHVGGFSTWVWKQGDLACFLISDMVSEDDLMRFSDYFVRVRRATEPLLSY